jgi:hypothetical protein
VAKVVPSADYIVVDAAVTLPRDPGRRPNDPGESRIPDGILRRRVAFPLITCCLCGRRTAATVNDAAGGGGMNWDAIGAIGEIVAAIATVATLIYLARQIHQNTRMSRAEITKDLYLASWSAILDLTSNDKLAEIWAQIREFDDADSARRYTFYQSFFRLYEIQFNFSKQDLFDDSIAMSYTLVIRMFTGTKHFDEY